MNNSNMKTQIQERDSFDLSFYQNYLGELYKEINKQRDFQDVYGYLDRTSGYLGKAVISKSYDEKTFVLPISWLFSLATILKIDLQDAFLKKFPGACPYCLEKQCVCFKTGKTPYKSIPAWKMKEEMSFKYETIRNTIKIINFDVAVKNVMDIFPVNEAIWHFAGAWHHIAKIHEEIAEIHEAFSSHKKEEKKLEAVAEEVADVFAWILGAWGILNQNKSLDDAFIDYYFEGCPLCKSFPCQCDLYDSRPDSLIDFKRLALMKENLDILQAILPKYQEDISELIKSYEYVLETQSAPMAKVSVSQTRDKLEKIKELITKNGVDPKSLSIINTIIDISETVLRLEVTQAVKVIHYDIFLSYSTSDNDEARKLEVYFSKNNVKVFMSEKEIKPGSKWEIDIKDALSNSKMMCVLATPNSIKSEWVTTEWAIAWAKNIRIVPVLLHCSASDLPDRLRTYQAIDFHEMSKIIETFKGLD